MGNSRIHFTAITLNFQQTRFSASFFNVEQQSNKLINTWTVRMKRISLTRRSKQLKSPIN